MIDIDVRLPLERFALEVKFRTDSRALALLGASGCGKTSLLETIAGLRTRATGKIVVEGRTLLDTPARIKLRPEDRRIGYVPQDSLLFPHLDVRSNIRFGMRRADGSESLFDDVVAMLEIGHLMARYPATLSGGERQRVALARALASAPRLLLLDEPLAALDVELKERILPYLIRVRDRTHLRTVYVTHSHEEAIAFAEEALLMDAGRIQAAGPPRRILGDVGETADPSPLLRPARRSNSN
jgi:molybdate transport system ATP-binding protein